LQVHVLARTVVVPLAILARVPPFTVNANRLDPYKNFKFRVKWDGRYVAGVSRISGLRRVTEVVKHRDGGDGSSSRKSPGRTEYLPIVLERGVTHDTEFERWANKVWDYTNAQAAHSDREVSLADFRKDIIIDVFNEAGQKVLSYHVFRCWVSEYQALPDLDADANAVAIEAITLQNEGWHRDVSVAEPTEPTFTED
jgi:phage tail-like protein